jgi:glutamine cyclotransferase
MLLVLKDMKQLKRLNNKAFIFLGLLISASCNNGTHSDPVTADNAGDNAIPYVISYDIVNIYPHDPAAFTEGLEYKDGFLYESTGQYGFSDIREVDLKTGKVLHATKMPANYFGEGLTILDGRIYQLTYKEGKGFIYDLKTLKEQGAFTFNAPEGWGMTNNGVDLIFDDGSNILHYIDPHTFKELKQLAVTDEHGPVNEINELELIHGFIYANQWETDNILKIDTATGRVAGRADLSSLRERAGIPQPSNNPHGPEVLNGIAYDAANNRIFITGKNWPKLLEIKLDN